MVDLNLYRVRDMGAIGVDLKSLYHGEDLTSMQAKINPLWVYKRYYHPHIAHGLIALEPCPFSMNPLDLDKTVLDGFLSVYYGSLQLPKFMINDVIFFRHFEILE